MKTEELKEYDSPMVIFGKLVIIFIAFIIFKVFGLIGLGILIGIIHLFSKIEINTLDEEDKQ